MAKNMPMRPSSWSAINVPRPIELSGDDILIFQKPVTGLDLSWCVLTLAQYNAMQPIENCPALTVHLLSSDLDILRQPGRGREPGVGA